MLVTACLAQHCVCPLVLCQATEIVDSTLLLRFAILYSTVHCCLHYCNGVRCVCDHQRVLAFAMYKDHNPLLSYASGVGLLLRA
jgi:hypothetical protein